MDFLDQYKKSLYSRMESCNKWQKRKVALMGLERQLKSYCHFSEHHSWNRQSEYIKLFDLFWDSVLECQLLEENVWKYHEAIRPENIGLHPYSDELEPNYNFCCIFACNVEEFLNTLLDDTEDEESYLLLFLDYIVCWLNETGENRGYDVEKYLSSRLIQNELTIQNTDIAEVFQINTFEAVVKWRMNVKNVLCCQD